MKLEDVKVLIDGLVQSSSIESEVSCKINNYEGDCKRITLSIWISPKEVIQKEIPSMPPYPKTVPLEDLEGMN